MSQLRLLTVKNIANGTLVATTPCMIKAILYNPSPLSH